MSKLTQNDLEYLIDMVQTGKMTADQANVEKVRMARVEVVSARIPADVRKSLNAAVKDGRLCHKKREGRKPEVYYHPSFEHLASGERNLAEMNIIKALTGIMARPDNLKTTESTESAQA